jgi:hypothetical protein
MRLFIASFLTLATVVAAVALADPPVTKTVQECAALYDANKYKFLDSRQTRDEFIASCQTGAQGTGSTQTQGRIPVGGIRTLDRSN